MKSLLKLSTLILVVLGFSATSFAQNNVTATASGTILTPIKITNVSNLKFGTLLLTAAGTVTLVPGGSASYSGPTAYTGITTIAPSTAKFTVDGTGTYGFSVTITNLPTVVTHTDASTTMGVTLWTSDLTSSAFSSTTLTGTSALVSGTKNFEVGATLTVGTSQLAGVYTSAPFTVTVNYQ